MGQHIFYSTKHHHSTIILVILLREIFDNMNIIKRNLLNLIKYLIKLKTFSDSWLIWVDIFQSLKILFFGEIFRQNTVTNKELLIRNNDKKPMITFIDGDDDGWFFCKTSFFYLSLNLLLSSFESCKIWLNQVNSKRNHLCIFDLLLIWFDDIKLHELNVTVDYLIVEPMFWLQSFQHSWCNWLKVSDSFSFLYYVTFIFINSFLWFFILSNIPYWQYSVEPLLID